MSQAKKAKVEEAVMVHFIQTFPEINNNPKGEYCENWIQKSRVIEGTHQPYIFHLL